MLQQAKLEYINKETYYAPTAALHFEKLLLHVINQRNVIFNLLAYTTKHFSPTLKYTQINTCMHTQTQEHTRTRTPAHTHAHTHALQLCLQHFQAQQRQKITRQFKTASQHGHVTTPIYICNITNIVLLLRYMIESWVVIVSIVLQYYP